MGIITQLGHVSISPRLLSFSNRTLIFLLEIFHSLPPPSQTLDFSICETKFPPP